MTSPSRRACLTGLAAGAATLVSAPLARAAGDGSVGGEPSLDAIARTRGLRFGSAIGGANFRDPLVRALLAAQCGVMTPENELKWKAVNNTEGVFTFEGADRLLDYATANGLEMRGHNLIWQNSKWLPDWVNAYGFGPKGAKGAEKLMTDHITAVMDRYRGRIHSWDVVNETIEPKTGEMRQTVFTRALGDRAIDIAYHAARQAAPDAQLVYNDYMSWEVNDETHRAGVLKLLERLKKDAVPVDALGLQSHIGVHGTGAATGMDIARPRNWKAFLDEVTGMGYALLVTEFDVRDGGLPANIEARDAAVAAYGKAYLDLTLSYLQVGQVITWGLVDKYSWLQSEAPRTDGAEGRPLPYDDQYQPAPLRAAIAEAMAHAPQRV